MRTALAAGTLLLAPAAPLRAELPPEDRCPTLRARPGAEREIDASAPRLREGQVVTAADLLSLRELLPMEVWSHRDQFFHAGMRMEIGPCHRRYPVPAFFAEATARFAGRARVDGEGNLAGYVAGLPFAPEAIDPGAPDAALRWAWNVAYRYRGAGPSGKFRLVDMPADLGEIQTYEGWFFFAQTAHRADLPESGYAVPDLEERAFAAGGRFERPYSARHLAWAQLRPLAAERDFEKPDDTFVYVPAIRRVRRAASSWVDGMFTPRYRVTAAEAGGAIPLGGDPFSMGGSAPGGGLSPPSAAASMAESLPRGFTELALRPNAYVWQLRGEREVLAPLNAAGEGYPRRPDRNYGESGLSVGSDRWDVRHAVLIEGFAKQRGGSFDRLLLYVDAQTHQPLYRITRRASGRLVEVSIPVHRFSRGAFGYAPWPDGGDASVFDPVAVVSFAAIDGSGWRREAFGIESVPIAAEELRKYVSTSYLMRGR